MKCVQYNDVMQVSLAGHPQAIRKVRVDSMVRLSQLHSILRTIMVWPEHSGFHFYQRNAHNKSTVKLNESDFLCQHVEMVNDPLHYVYNVSDASKV